ncbi:hypothetical protein [Bradyrhizobium diazoefficiens]|uniref:hypothetical protein n=1 Tax=Bradyrhizobium diazoefficiens TaxID=1355477 RepID=UPI00272CAEB8|nr:hypothetical protein [Bradyrhizobium diazoefficiens]WLA66801.1 hypothetical protein QNN01_08900 [Bradyrhizobium diazoefficiens]
MITKKLLAAIGIVSLLAVPAMAQTTDKEKNGHHYSGGPKTEVRAGPGCLDSAPLDLSGFLPGYAERGALRFCRCVGRA